MLPGLIDLSQDIVLQLREVDVRIPVESALCHRLCFVVVLLLFDGEPQEVLLRNICSNVEQISTMENYFLMLLSCVASDQSPQDNREKSIYLWKISYLSPRSSFLHIAMTNGVSFYGEKN